MSLPKRFLRLLTCADVNDQSIAFSRCWAGTPNSRNLLTPAFRSASTWASSDAGVSR
jgi:hypothetical protein